MKIQLCGAPESNKTELSQFLIQEFGVVKHLDGNLVSEFYSVGQLTDYRVELKIAIDRAMTHLAEYQEPSLFTHTLVDSLAYSSVRLMHMLNSGSVSEREVGERSVAVQAISLLLIDSFRPDNLLFLPVTTEDYFNNEIDHGIREVVKQFNIPYEDLGEDLEQQKEKAATIVQELLAKDNNETDEGANSQGLAEEPDGEDK